MPQVVAVGQEDQPFVGRENELKEYWDFLAGKSNAPWLLVISGLGGIGKSALLNKLYKQTLEQRALPDTFAILLNFDTSTPTEPSLQTKTTQPDASLRTDPLLFLDELAQLLKPHCDIEQFDAFTGALQRGRIQLAQFKEQVEQTRQSFAHEHGMQPPPDARQKIRFAEQEVNRQVREMVTEAFYRQVDTFQPERLVIMLDTCELLNESDSWIFSQWLMNEFLPELHSRTWHKPCFVVMAGRIPPESEVINEYNQQHLILSMLEKSAVDTYLEKMGMLDPALRHSVYKITRGHALCVAIIGQFYQSIGQEALHDIDTGVLQAEFDESVSLELINERILNRLDNPFKDLTQFGVLIRTFTLPLFRAVFPDLLPESDAKAIFDQFIRYPYIESRGNYRYAFHELIREVLAKNTQKKDLSRWRKYHKQALDYFSAVGFAARPIDWYYHNLAYEEDQGIADWREALEEARDRGDTQRVSSLLQVTDDVALNLTALFRAECAYEWGRLSVDRRQPLDKALEKYAEALRIYAQVEDHPEEVRQRRADVLQAIGDVQQSKVQLNKALNSYQEALELLQRCEKRSTEAEAQVLKKIGDVQQLLGNLGDLNSALESYKQALRLFRQVGNNLLAAQVLKDMGDVQQLRHQLVGDLGDLNVALEDYDQALGLFRQAKNRSKEDEAKLLEAIGDVHRSRYQLSRDQQDLGVAIESYQQAFGLFIDDTNARKRVKEKVETQKQRNELTGPLAHLHQSVAYPSPPPQKLSSTGTKLLIGLLAFLLILLGSIGSFFLFSKQQPIPIIKWTVTPTSLNPSSPGCTGGLDAPRCTVILSETTDSQKTINWSASSDMSDTTIFYPAEGTLSPGKSVAVVISEFPCQNGSFTFTGSRGISPIRVAWHCISKVRLNTKYQEFGLTVHDINGLLNNSPPVIIDIEQQIRKQSFLQQGSVGLSIVYGGAPNEAGIPEAQAIANKVYRILAMLGQQGFAFQRSSYYVPLYYLGQDFSQVTVDVYLYQT